MPFLVPRIIGSVLIVAGLYSVLWGKHKENEEKEGEAAMEIPVAIKAVDGNGRIMEIVELDEVQLEKAQANTNANANAAVAVTAVPAAEARMQGKDDQA
jgi:hypothetical protein